MVRSSFKDEHPFGKQPLNSLNLAIYHTPALAGFRAVGEWRVSSFESRAWNYE